MEVEEQISEDGEIVKSPTKHSPIQLSKDPSTFNVSEDEDAEDTADSLDIKPPQAAVAHHHKSGSRSAASKRERDKHHSKDPLRDHGHVSIKSEATSISHRKSHHRSHREHREERFREKRHHRQRHEGSRDGSGKYEHDFSRSKAKEKSGGERMLEDLRERLLDKRRAGGKHERRERREEEEGVAMAAAVRETPREKAERVEREIRRERLLEADREMVRQKEVYRRELEARRERHYLEKEKERTLREIAKRRERSRSQERKKRRVEEGQDEDEAAGGPRDKDEATEHGGKKESGDDDGGLASQLVVVSSGSEPEDQEPERGQDGKEHSDGELDGTQENSSAGEDEEAEEDEEGEEEEDEEEEDEEEDSSSSSDTEEDDRDTDVSEGRHTEDEQHFHSHVRSPSRSVSRGNSGEDTPLKKDRHMQEDDEDMLKKGETTASPPPRAADLLVEKQSLLPPYLPAIQGCRSVDEFQCLNRIEEGTYGVVYRAKDLRTQEVVALKRLKMEKEKEGFPITSLREINTLLKAQHSNIVTVREIVVGSNMDKIYIVMDYVEHDLKSLMETMKSKKQVFIPGEVKCLMQQLLRAVAHLHDNWILHRDLKTSNLLLSHKGILKVGDFGLAREYGSPLKHYTPIVVTLWYRAPELLLCSKEYSTPIDMWSVGCIFGEFLTMEALFPGKSEVDQLNRIFKELGTPNEKVWPGYGKLPAVQKMTFTEYPVNQLRQRFGSTMMTDTGMELMNRFLTYDPSQRITAEEALKHEYFREAPLPIDPAMFPTWPAKSELGHRKAAAASPKPPPGGAEYKQLGDTDEDIGSMGFHMGVVEKGRAAPGAGFSLKF